MKNCVCVYEMGRSGRFGTRFRTQIILAIRVRFHGCGFHFVALTRLILLSSRRVIAKLETFEREVENGRVGEVKVGGDCT